ncbi:MAG: hypothetical protein RLZZ262_2436 [Bacteroidota bacterium]|jgi:hypothetical protein
MDFTIHLIDTVVLCDNALLAANKTQSDLEFKRLSLTRDYDDAMEAATLAQAELTNAQSELASTLATIEALPPGKTEDDMIKRRMQLELKIFTLSRRVEGQGILGMLEKQYDIQRIDQELQLNATFIALLSERKLELINEAA